MEALKQHAAIYFSGGDSTAMDELRIKELVANINNTGFPRLHFSNVQFFRHRKQLNSKNPLESSIPEDFWSECL